MLRSIILQNVDVERENDEEEKKKKKGIRCTLTTDKRAYLTDEFS